MSTTPACKPDFEAVIDACPIGIFTTDAAGDVLFINSAGERLLGISSADAAGKGWARAVHPDDLPRVQTKWYAAVRSGAIFGSEHRFVHAGGEVVWVCAKASQVRAADGVITGFAGTIEDITPRKADEIALRASELQARQTLHDLQFQRYCLDEHAIVSETDARGRITYVNDKFCQISGYSREELLGKDHRILNSGHHPREFWTQMYRVLASGQTWRGDVKNRTKDGATYWVDTTNVAVRGTDGRIVRYVSIRADITAHKHMEEELQQAKLVADAANRAKSEFLANMSHEIRTPMTAILGYTDLLCEESGWGLDASRRKDALETIRRNGSHLLTIINDILDLSKIEAGRMNVESVDTSPTSVIEEVRSLMQVRAAEKRLHLLKDIVYPLPRTIKSDPTRLRQILVNLVSNAIKFTAAGDVTLRCSLDPKDQTRVLFEVIDNGIGMTAEQISRLFEPFGQADSRTSRRFGGTGLGLVISRRFARMLGGEVSATSQYGHGSCFTLSLDAGLIKPDHTHADAAPTDAEETERGRSPASTSPLAGRRILMAEDGPDNRQLIGYCLRRAGGSVQIVENGKEALTEATRPEAAFDVILMDMQMPVMDGYLATSLMRRKGLKTPIIALTAHAMVEDRQRCLDAGCDDYATKPINRRALIDLVARWAEFGTAKTTV